jgi:hypothetical protein
MLRPNQTGIAVDFCALSLTYNAHELVTVIFRECD